MAAAEGTPSAVEQAAVQVPEVVGKLLGFAYKSAPEQLLDASLSLHCLVLEIAAAADDAALAPRARARVAAWVAACRLLQSKLFSLCRIASYNSANTVVQQQVTSAAKTLRQVITITVETYQTAKAGEPAAAPSDDFDLQGQLRSFKETIKAVTEAFRFTSNVDDTQLSQIKDMLAACSEITLGCLAWMAGTAHPRGQRALMEATRDFYEYTHDLAEAVRSHKRVALASRALSDHIPVLQSCYRAARQFCVADDELSQALSMFGDLGKLCTESAQGESGSVRSTEALELAPLLQDVIAAAHRVRDLVTGDQPSLVASAAGYHLAERVQVFLATVADTVLNNKYLENMTGCICDGAVQVMSILNAVDHETTNIEDDIKYGRPVPVTGTNPIAGPATHPYTSSSLLAIQVAAALRMLASSVSMLSNQVLGGHMRVRASSRGAQKGRALVDSEATENVNIWDDSDAQGEPSTERGTLNSLVRQLTSEKSHDPNFMKAFITTYHSFTTPEILFDKLVERYNVPKKDGVSDEDWRKTIAQPIILRVCNVLQHWIDTHFLDFDAQLLEKIQAFVKTLGQNGHENLSKKLTTSLTRKIDSRLNAGELDISKDVRFCDFVVAPIRLMLDCDVEEVAKQLSLVDFEVYSSIQPVELLNQAWNAKKYKHRAPNLLHLIARFNAVSNWVASVVLYTEDIASRAKVWARFVQLADQLRLLNNFQSLMAVLGGLNSVAAYRLKFTKEELPKKTQDTFADLESLMNSQSSFKKYRETLHTVNPPCLPYIGIYLTDLTHIEDGNPNTVDGLINFQKRTLVHNVISEIHQYQQSGYDYARIPTIFPFVRDLPYTTDNSLYTLSVLREPRGCERPELL